jgi:tripartite-type tricarboxylate transporter receptor subunit TctC
MSGELFKMLAAVDIVHVPYRGSAPMLTDLLGGQVQAAFDNLPASIEHIRAGKLRALAVTTATRSEALPDIPTVGDFVPGYEASGWFGGGKDGDGEGHPGLKVARTRCHRQRQATGGVGRFT